MNNRFVDGWIGAGQFRVFAAILLVMTGIVAAVGPAQAESADTGTVLITGSNRGIGLEFARQYAELGWRVIATCRNPKTATELQALSKQYSRLVIEQLDVTDHSAIDALADKYRDTPIDVLLNNAGISGRHLAQSSDSRIDE